MDAVFRAVAVTVVPEAAQLDAAGWGELEGIVERSLAERPPWLVRRLTAFLHLLDWLALLRYGRWFGALDATRRSRLLASLQRAPLLLLRRGCWGLRTLVLMGYYGRPAAAAEIGYGADRLGWEGRR